MWYVPGSKRGVDPRITWQSYVDNEVLFIKTQASGGELDDTERKVVEYVEAKELGTVMFDNYLATYGNDESWTVIAPEQAFQVIIPDPDDPKSPLVQYDGTFDGVYRDEQDGRLKLMEHKTAAQISLAHLSLDDQAGSYWAISTQILRHQGLIGPKESIWGITYNFARKGRPDLRPKNEQGHSLNKDGSVSKTQSAPLLKRHEVRRSATERRRQISRIQDEAIAMSNVRSGVTPIYKNPTKDCSWDCDFFEMCELHESTPDWEDFRDAMFRVEDPYKDHRK